MTVMALTRGTGATPGATTEAKLSLAVLAASVGTLLAWYDFYLFSALTEVLGKQFFSPQADPNTALLLGLGAGFVARPFGAVVFGYLGDRFGRKHALVLSLLLAGGSTFIVGLLPGYAAIGALAPLLLALLRVIQGLALGGEYGGAATYVAEYAPDGKRGFYTGWIQTTATLGIVLALLLILACRAGLGDASFADWGWRVPFLISAILVPLSLYIRLKLAESPLHARLREQGKAAVNPAKESFTSAGNWRLIALALFGATAPEGVVWYTGQFYALFYLASVLKVPYVTIYVLMMIVLSGAAPFFVVFGALSDKVGRRNIMTLGFALAAISYGPVFGWMADVKDNPFVLGLLVFYVVILATMVYGPIAAFLVELFPARIRYTSMSLPYHLGNGVFGGLVPLAGAATATAFGGPLYGLVYPVGVAALGVVVSLAGLKPRTNEVRIWQEVGGEPPPVLNQP